MWQMRVLANTKAILHVQPSPCLHETKKPPPIGNNLEKKSQPHFKTYGYNNYFVSHLSI